MTRTRILGIIFIVALLVRLGLLLLLPSIAQKFNFHIKYNMPGEWKLEPAPLQRLSWIDILNRRVELIPFQEDERAYDELATNALAGKGLSVYAGWFTVPPGKPASYWNFLYPFFLATTYFIFGHHQLPVFILQAILNSAAICVLYLLASRVFNKENIGIVSALIACFHPILVFLPALMMTEALFVPLMIFTFYCFFLALDTEKLKWYVACGFCFALASLTRETSFYFFPVLGLLVFLKVRKNEGNRLAFLKSGVLLAAIFLTITPWTIRNYMVHHRFLPLSTKIGINLWMYNNPYQKIGWEEIGRNAPTYELPETMTEVDRDRYYLHLALKYIFSNPGRVISNLPWKFLRAINPSLGTAKSNFAQIIAGLFIARCFFQPLA